MFGRKERRNMEDAYFQYRLRKARAIADLNIKRAEEAARRKSREEFQAMFTAWTETTVDDIVIYTVR